MRTLQGAIIASVVTVLSMATLYLYEDNNALRERETLLSTALTQQQIVNAEQGSRHRARSATDKLARTLLVEARDQAEAEAADMLNSMLSQDEIESYYNAFNDEYTGE